MLRRNISCCCPISVPMQCEGGEGLATQSQSPKIKTTLRLLVSNPWKRVCQSCMRCGVCFESFFLPLFLLSSSSFLSFFSFLSLFFSFLSPHPHIPTLTRIYTHPLVPFFFCIFTYPLQFLPHNTLLPYLLSQTPISLSLLSSSPSLCPVTRY